MKTFNKLCKKKLNPAVSFLLIFLNVFFKNNQVNLSCFIPANNNLEILLAI